MFQTSLVKLDMFTVLNLLSVQFRDLVNNVATYRPNISPLLEDARMPERYAMFISGKVDTIYCDVAQPEQAKLVG